MYTAKLIENIKTGEGCWNNERIGIFEDDKKIGEFERNYHGFGIETFYPFKYNNKWYAIYSHKYIAISVMSLPDCKEVAHTEFVGHGFCPVETWVPTYKYKKDAFTLNNPKTGKDKSYAVYYPEIDFEKEKEDCNDLPTLYHDFAFVAGCVWGDDSCWKIRLLDLKDLDNGKIGYKDIGYLEMPVNLSLQKAVLIDAEDFEEDGTIRLSIAVTKHIRFNRKMSKLESLEDDGWKEI